MEKDMEADWEELSVIHLLNSPKAVHPDSRGYGKDESGIDVAFGLYDETAESEDSFLVGLQNDELKSKFRLTTRMDEWQADRSVTFSPRTPNFKPLEESFSNLRDEKERKKNTTLKLRLEGMKKTIQELERKLHEKDREVLLWKQKSAQQTRQVRTLSKQPPPKTRTVVENRHEHRKVEEQLQKQIDQLLQDITSHKARETRLNEVNGMIRMRYRDMQDVCKTQERTIQMYEADFKKLKKTIQEQARKLKMYTPSDYRIEGLPSAAQLVEELNAVTQQQQAELDRSKQLRQQIRMSRSAKNDGEWVIDTPPPVPLVPQRSKRPPSDQDGDSVKEDSSSLDWTDRIRPGSIASRERRPSADRVDKIRAMYDRVYKKGLVQQM